MKVINSVLSKEQIDNINTNLFNLPKKLSKDLKIKRILMDILVLFFCIYILYIQYKFTIPFLILSSVITLVMTYGIYIHTNEKKNYALELFRLRQRNSKRMLFKIYLDNTKIILSNNMNDFDKFIKLLYWRNLIVVVIENKSNEKKLVFLSLQNNNKTEFLTKMKDIYNLSLENIENDMRLNNYIKSDYV